MVPIRSWAEAVIAVVALAAGVGGCANSYGPPLRMTGFGAPDGAAGGRIEAGAAGHGVLFDSYIMRPGGGPVLAVGLTDWLALEGTYDWSHELSVSGTGAVRFTVPVKNVIVDMAVGGGGGRGGILCDNKGLDGSVYCPGDRVWDGKEWFERPFGGGLIDIGIAAPSREDAVPFARFRFQLSDADNIPLTAWYSLMIGAEVTLREALAVHGGLGLSAWHNRDDRPFDQYKKEYGQYNVLGHFFENNLNFFVEVGITVRMNLFPER